MLFHVGELDESALQLLAVCTWTVGENTITSKALQSAIGAADFFGPLGTMAAAAGRAIAMGFSQCAGGDC